MLVKMVYAMIWVMKLKYAFFGSPTCSPVRLSVVTQHLTSHQLSFGSHNSF